MKLIPLKITYFILMAAQSVLQPYLPVFMGVLKLTPIQMSLILGIATTLSAPFRMVVGYLADRLQAREVVFAIMALLTTLFHLSLYFTPTEESPSLVHNDYITRGGLCSNSSHFTLEAFNETVSIIINSSSYNRSGIKCCFDGSTCFDMSYGEGDIKYLIVSNLSDVEQWFTSKYTPPEDQSHCIDLQNCNRTTIVESEPIDNHKTFWVFLVLNLFAQATCSPLLSLLDSLIYIALTKIGKPKEFGKSCLWGVLGFGLFAFVSGAIQDYLKQQGRESRETYVFTFVMFCLGMVVVAAIAVATRSPAEVSKTVDTEAVESNLAPDEQNSLESEIKPLNDDSNVKTSIFQDTKELMTILCGFYISTIIVTAMISGMLAGCLEGFFYYFLASLDPNNKLVLGACLAVSSICEVIVLFFSGRILSQLGSKNSLYLVFAVFVIRFMASSYLENPWYGLLVDAIQCISFGLLYPVMTSWASSLVPSKFQSTVLCYVGAVYLSLGRAVGTGIAGVLYEKLGPRVMFNVFAAISGGFLIVLIFIFEVVDRIRLKRLKKEEISDDKDGAATNCGPEVSVINMEAENGTTIVT